MSILPGQDYLIAFPCTHTFHLPCLLQYSDPDAEHPSILNSFTASDTEDIYISRSIAPKVDRAALLRTVVGGGCPVPAHKVDEGG